MATRKQGGLFSGLLRRADSPQPEATEPRPAAPAPAPAMPTQPTVSPAPSQAAPGSGAGGPGLAAEVSTPKRRPDAPRLTLYGLDLLVPGSWDAPPGPGGPHAATRRRVAAARLPAQPPPAAAPSPTRRPVRRAWTASPSPPPLCARCRWRSWCAGARWWVLGERRPPLAVSDGHTRVLPLSCPPAPSRSLTRCPPQPDPAEQSDPVILATGHTYDRASIERWLAQGHKTCPVTGMRLRHLELTPNFALRSAILDWAAANGVKLPERVTQPPPQPVFKWEEGRAGNILHVRAPAAVLGSTGCCAAGCRLCWQRDGAAARCGLLPSLPPPPPDVRAAAASACLPPHSLMHPPTRPPLHRPAGPHRDHLGDRGARRPRVHRVSGQDCAGVGPEQQALRAGAGGQAA